MLISELTVYDFLKEKMKLSDSDAKRYAKDMAFAEEKLKSEIDVHINTKFKETDYVTKMYLDTRISQLEVRIEKGFKEVIIWVIGFTVAIVGLAVAIIKLF